MICKIFPRSYVYICSSSNVCTFFSILKYEASFSKKYLHIILEILVIVASQKDSATFARSSDNEQYSHGVRYMHSRSYGLAWLKIILVISSPALYHCWYLNVRLHFKYFSIFNLVLHYLFLRCQLPSDLLPTLYSSQPPKSTGLMYVRASDCSQFKSHR